MFLSFLYFVHTADLTPQIDPQNDQVIFTEQGPAETIPSQADIALVQWQEYRQHLYHLQLLSTVADYTCQLSQIALTIPQLTSHLSEETGIWLNSFNLSAGIIAIAQIPLKKWIDSRLTQTEQVIARLQEERLSQLL